MGEIEDVARLKLETNADQFARELAKGKAAMDSQGREVYELADTYELLDAAVDRSAEHVEQLRQAQQRYTAAAAAQADTLGRLGIRIEASAAGQAKLVGAAASATRGMGALQQQITAGSYAFQDFTATSGDLGAKLNSVSNNLPTLLLGLGGLGTVISVAATAGIALYRNWDSVTGLFETRHPFPKTTKDLEGLKDSLHDVSKEIEKLKEQGPLSDRGLARANELLKEEANLKAAIKVREKLDHIKEQRSEAEEQVAKAFEKAVEQSGAKKSLEKLEKDLSSSAVPGLKNLFTDIFTKIDKGNLDAYNALMEFAKASPEKYGDLARELESQLKTAFKQGGPMGPMDDVVKKFKEDAKRVMNQLNEEGAEAQRDLIDEMAKDARTGVLAIAKEPLEALAIKGRAMGAEVGKEVSHLKNEVEAETARLFPELQKMFPKAFAGVVDQIVLAVRESVDKTVEQLQALEGLTKQEALRRLNMQRQEKGQRNAEDLALDEFGQAAGRNYRKNAALDPTAPALTPEMQREMGRQIQQQLKAMGVSPQEQVAIGKALNDPRAQRAIPAAMQGLMGAGLDEAGAMRQLPNVLGQMRAGAGGVGQAVDRVLNGLARQQRAALNRAAAGQARPPARARGVPKAKAPARKFGKFDRPVPAALTPADRAAAARKLGGALARDRRAGGFRSVAPAPPGDPGQEGAQALGLNQQFVQLARSGLQAQGQLGNALQQVQGQVRQLQAAQADLSRRILSLQRGGQAPNDGLLNAGRR